MHATSFSLAPVVSSIRQLNFHLFAGLLAYYFRKQGGDMIAEIDPTTSIGMSVEMTRNGTERVNKPFKSFDGCLPGAPCL